MWKELLQVESEMTVLSSEGILVSSIMVKDIQSRMAMSTTVKVMQGS
jgi:hypothetical protein